ncbi:glycosyltransferase [Acinetobacter sp. YH16042]|uniref:glycosyltransferase n=1 Tax=Acinetobacter sp. YH16042 TaxID=2601186 RepID=UPI0015D201CE|nr:glycosyltransferase [Acinetobacter sp. YH16042]
MKTICVISTNWLKDEIAFRNHLLSMINGLLKKGYFVNLISMDESDYILLENVNFKHHKIQFLNTKISSFVKRGALEAKISLNAINKANVLNCDYNLVMIPSMFLLHFSFLLKGKNNILDIRDLSWEYLSEKSIVKRLAKNFFKLLASLNLKNFFTINVNSTHELNYILDLGFSKNSIIQVQNGVSEEVYSELSQLVDKDEITKPTITYIGNVGLAQDLSTFVEASKVLKDWNFNIVGHGTDFNRIQCLVDQNQENIKFWGQVDFVKIKDLYIASDVLYAQLTPEFSGAMPSKLYEYIVTGRYVIYGGVGEACNNLKKFENVSIIEPLNSNVLVNELIKLKKSKAFFAHSDRNKLMIQKEFVRENIIDNFIDFFESKLNS